MTHPPLTPPREAAFAGNATHPLDVEEADRSADEALSLELGTTTRPEIDDYTLQLKGQIAVFAEALRDGGGVEARGSWLEADQLLAGGPADGVLVFSAWNYVRDLARLLRKLVAEYRKQLEHKNPTLPPRTPLADLGALTASRQTYLVPSGLAPKQKPMPADSEHGRP